MLWGQKKKRSLIFNSQISKKIKVKLDHEGSGWVGNKERGCQKHFKREITIRKWWNACVYQTKSTLLWLGHGHCLVWGKVVN